MSAVEEVRRTARPAPPLYRAGPHRVLRVFHEAGRLALT